MTVAIANLALERCASPLLARLDDRGEIASKVRRHLPRAVSWTLRRKAWSDLTVVAAVRQASISDTALPKGFCFAYFLPADYVRMYRLSFGDGQFLDGDDWRVMNLETGSGRQRVIVTRRKIEHIEYVAEPYDLDSIPSDLVDVIALKLAMYLITPLKVNAAERDRIEAEYNRVMMEVGLTDAAHDGEEIELTGGDLMEARLGLWNGTRNRG
ncbi:MAG: hypothetical protein AAFQ58_19230 [Pseudomonadota bacterium]